MNKEESIFSNGLFEFINTEDEFVIDGQKKIIKRSMVRRPPGIRALIINKNERKILLSKEFRYEINGWDYRLPGGKVFDTLAEYKKSINENTLMENVEKTVPKEVLEELGIIVKNQRLIKISSAGSSLIWDLYYYEINDYELSDDGSKLEENEIVDGYVWKNFDEVTELCISQEIHEDRTVSVLLTYILSNK